MPPGPGAFRPCNLCGERDDLAFVFRVGAYTIVRCHRCGLVYTNELPSRAELDEIYSSRFFEVGAKFDSTGERGPGVLNARDRAAALSRLPDVGTDTWLDLGCATGDFLVAAAGTVRRPSGIEISEHAAAIARSRGADVETGDFLEAQSRPHQVDVVTMWDYIEHVRDPAANLERAREILRDGGYLAVSTGDVGSRVARLTGRYWHLMIPPRHLYFFSERTLWDLLGRHGFSVVSVRRDGKRVPLDFAAWKATSLVVPSLADAAGRAARRLGLGRLAPSVNLYDIMTVIARKRQA